MCIYAERESVHLFRAFWDNISSSAPNEEKILFKYIQWKTFYRCDCIQYIYVNMYMYMYFICCT